MSCFINAVCYKRPFEDISDLDVAQNEKEFDTYILDVWYRQSGRTHLLINAGATAYLEAGLVLSSIFWIMLDD